MNRPDRFQRLINRRTPLEKQASAALKSFSAGAQPDEHKYIVDCMQPIDAEYTEITFREAERVKAQLSNWIPQKFLTQFDYQGSVTTDSKSLRWKFNF